MATSQNKTVRIYVHSSGSWFPARPYQSHAFFDFQKKGYQKRTYCSSSDLVSKVAVGSFVDDDKNRDCSLFPSTEDFVFQLIRDGMYVFLANDKGEFHLVTDSADTVGADYLKDLQTTRTTDSKNVSGIALSRLTEYRPDNSGSTWFEKIFGFDERVWQRATDIEHLPMIINNNDGAFTKFSEELFDRSPVLTIRFQKNRPSRKLLIGKFGTPTLAEIRSFALSKYNEDQSQSVSQSTINNVVVGDVFNTHSDPAYKGALFQVASQFNCLEFPSSDVVPENGITGYVYDRTQGPACSIPVGGATFYRNYVAPVENGVVDSKSKKSGQTTDNQINCLIDVLSELEKMGGEKFVSVHNGYTFSSNEKLTRLNLLLSRMSTQAMSKLMDKLRIGTQFGAGVYLDRNRNVISQEKLQLVSQAFCSAISISYSGLNAKSWEPFAKAVLKASYEATLWSAVINKNIGGSNKVVLTCVGGGVFGNRLEWIADAICEAFIATEKYGLDIEIGHYSESNQAEFLAHFNKARKTYGI
ncbi:hypothetical protein YASMINEVIRUS_1576 [Yasminevirus sp. GU-2018]|uniref:Uncharacterized protein n=1 Tax=Yasminevirus sp. GU-2018 TaxID=2420051 RepID=A0A5K0UBT0_9VIRU|nr:hypothetical protein YASMINEVIRUS_1576 [Yasminevirus sp. GU-2018]